ncbi:imidazole glycerol phosphate synthase subunit HisH [Aestuariimicrobium kwangyangense]|uniref:imidazole glycerol phosphate synthase subunit HisH n=1 Tax=Aestuariimicrobium kwangyangense TaxID=396389 RepID=UPI0003B59314|nr:imidazole glycerol phosphate synthase subunit HisH [Aestuariimicrobium kwangyangense]
MVQVALVDSGGTNIGSVADAVERLGGTARLTADPAEILRADRVILPGVGAAGAAMARLNELDLIAVLRDVRVPMLGVCVGSQLLFEHSEEDGGVDLLGYLPGRVTRLPGDEHIRIPHMGWNTLELLADDPILAGISTGERGYFVHSYAAPVTGTTLAACEHGTRFAAVVRGRTAETAHIWGCQFHPEKSAAVGSRLLANFLSPAISEGVTA